MAALYKYVTHQRALTCIPEVGDGIIRADIWAYIYGVLHAQDWRTRYANDLRKALPSIPLAADFGVFRDTGL